MFIDKSYFVGPLTIAQLGDSSVLSSLQDFIDIFEPKLLEAALGYDFYQAFLNGINVGSGENIDQRWLNLLNGVAFVNLANIKKKFNGFAGGNNTFTIQPIQRDNLTLIAGQSANFRVDVNSYADVNLFNWLYDLESFGVGTLEQGLDWDYLPNGGWKLLDNSYKTSYGERFVLHFKGKKLGVQNTGLVSVSPLACFIYYEYQRGLYSQVTGVGVVKSKAQNADNANPALKMATAFNEGCRQISILWEYLMMNKTNNTGLYPEFDPIQIYGFGYGYGIYNPYYAPEDTIYDFRPINQFGI